FDAQLLFEIALLSGAQIAVEDDEGRTGRGDGSGELADLARPDERGGLHTVARLHVALGDDRAGAGGELGELLERFVGVKRLSRAFFELEPNQDRLFRCVVRRRWDSKPRKFPG